MIALRDFLFIRVIPRDTGLDIRFFFFVLLGYTISGKEDYI